MPGEEKALQHHMMAFEGHAASKLRAPENKIKTTTTKVQMEQSSSIIGE
jgi:hypothetical protein